jgi:hypothetical protein
MMLRTRLLMATIARTRRQARDLLASLMAVASTAGLRRELLQKAQELERQAEEAEAELRRLRHE